MSSKENLEKNANSEFYVKPTDNNESIEMIDNFEMTNEFKQKVCIPYFGEIHKVSFYL